MEKKECDGVKTVYFPPEPETKFVDYGLGVYIREKNTIYLNKCLKKDPKVMAKVVEHELFHAYESSFLSNVLYDLKPDISLFWYSLTNPSTLTSLFPLQKVENMMIINPINLVLYILTIILGGILWIQY